ncbi:hypothetical protein GIB67_022114 [Kingdonia uniflora]|uniref:Aminotransferase-like plant mobile domain-containing protein n=1 Tax=Kingdonia uniflora TaxID=39325 RepID=A0A7J7LY16_9MAGN|nr:hypothetical protein GIB67_022114 [Kingdonia uniflora]
MSSEEEEYTESSDEKEEYDECKVSQLRFLSDKKWKVKFEEVLNVSTEPPPPLPKYYGPRDFRQVTQPDGNDHLSTSVATTSVPQLKQKLKATNLMSVFDCKIGNGDNQVVLAMVERWWPSTHTFHLLCGELGITPRDFTVLTGIGIGIGEPIIFEDFYTEYGKALNIFPAMEFKDYEKGCVSFAHLETYLDHTRVDFNDKGNTKVIFRAFMLLYFGASKQEAKYIGGLFQLIEYHCYEYCQIDHHILIDNRNMKGALKQEVVIAGNINRKKVLLQCSFGGYEWYLGDRCWAQLEHRAVSYDPPEKLHCFPTDNLVTFLQEAGWIKAQHYIVGHHVDYDANWRHVSHGALMSDIARCGNIDIPGPGTLTGGVTFPHVEFPTVDFFTQERQISPPQFGDYPGWTMELGSPHGTTWHTIPSSAMTSTIDVPAGYDFFTMTEEGRLSQLNEYLDGQGIEVEWENDEGEAKTSQAGTSHGRGLWGRTSEGRAALPRRSRRTWGSFI